MTGSDLIRIVRAAPGLIVDSCAPPDDGHHIDYHSERGRGAGLIIDTTPGRPEAIDTIVCRTIGQQETPTVRISTERMEANRRSRSTSDDSVAGAVLVLADTKRLDAVAIIHLPCATLEALLNEPGSQVRRSPGRRRDLLIDTADYERLVSAVLRAGGKASEVRMFRRTP